MQINKLASGCELNYCESLPKSLIRPECKEKSCSYAYSTKDRILKCHLSQWTTFSAPPLPLCCSLEKQDGQNMNCGNQSNPTLEGAVPFSLAFLFDIVWLWERKLPWSFWWRVHFYLKFPNIQFKIILKIWIFQKNHLVSISKWANPSWTPLTQTSCGSCHLQHGEPMTLNYFVFAPCLMPKGHRVHSETTQGSVNSFIRDQIINNLSFAGQEAKAKTWCRYL